MKDYKSPFKSVSGNEGDKCHYPDRLDTYGCGCSHDCKYCYAKSLLEFRGLWDASHPAVGNLSEISREIRKLQKSGVKIVRLGGMTDCFQPIESLHRITYKTIRLLNKYRVEYLIVTKSAMVAEYMDVLDPGLAHIQITVTTLDNDLAANQQGKLRCGDNGIFKGVPVTSEQRLLTEIAQDIYSEYKSDGKYVIDGDTLIICQSNDPEDELYEWYDDWVTGAIINPLGYWTGGTDVDSGATNRKLGSDMGDSVTGGGLHGKDLSKADVSVNIYAWLKAQKTGKEINLCCAIGDEFIDRKPYEEIVKIARDYITKIGGFEKFAEWGLIR